MQITDYEEQVANYDAQVKELEEELENYRSSQYYYEDE